MANMRETRLQIMLDDNELAAIDNWRFKQRMPSRAAAIRQLLNLALRLKDSLPAGSGRRSQDFGLLTGDDEASAADK
jgi:metal-responsive CopG/Arc/MetJ family transcriptional regulator